MNPFKIIILFLLINTNLSAQNSKAKHWVLGMELNVVDDDGRRPILAPKNFFNGLNFLPFPTAFSFEYYLKDNFSMELSESVNTYEVGEFVDGASNPKNIFFMALDFNAKYSFNSLYSSLSFSKKINWFDPYIMAGFGVTHRNAIVPTFNGGGGATFWVSKKIGVNIQSMGKLSFSDKGSFYFQHLLGVKLKF